MYIVLKLHRTQDSLILKEIPIVLSFSMEGKKEMDKMHYSRATSEKNAPPLE